MRSDGNRLAEAFADATEQAVAWVGDENAERTARAREFVLHAFSLGAEMWVLKADANAPEFTIWEHPWRKFGGDNPWTVYACAPVHPANTYRITGTVGDPTYVGFQVYATQGGFNVPSGNVSLGALKPVGPGEAARLRGTLPDALYTSIVFYDTWFTTLAYPGVPCFRTDRDLTLDGDGTYDVVIGPTDPGLNGADWIDTGGHTEGIVAIRTLKVRRRELPEIEIISV